MAPGSNIVRHPRLSHECPPLNRMHVLEGSKEEIEKQLRTSLEAFFDLYPEI